jgi:nucleoside-diphosphate-sugar epimerase
MPRLLLTGASGYLGQRLCTRAAERGWDVVVLGTAPVGATIARRFDWRLAEDAPAAAFAGVTAVVHLAHSWSSDGESRAPSSNLNLVGSERLARAAFAAGVSRFVFASTTSARLRAPNAYGQVKFAIEELLLSLPAAADRLACARIGLVYGGPEHGQYGLLSKLVRLSPALPMVAVERKVQPIHLDEVVAGLLALANGPCPPSGNATTAISVLAGPVPISFGDWLRMLRRSHTGKGLVLLPIPLWMALVACELTRLVPFVPTVDRERILGLAGTSPMESARDLAALGVEVVAPVRRLATLRAARRQMIAEARSMLSYVSGRRIPPRAAIARLVRAFNRNVAQPLWMPRFVLNRPWLLHAFEPLRVNAHHGLALRLHLSVIVAESMGNGEKPRGAISALVGLGVLEIAMLPFRAMLGRIYA